MDFYIFAFVCWSARALFGHFFSDKDDETMPTTVNIASRFLVYDNHISPLLNRKHFPQEQRRSKKSLRKIGIVDLFVLSQIKMKIPADYRKIETRYPDEVLLKKVA